MTSNIILGLLWEYRKADQKVTGRKSSRIGVRLDLELARTRNVDGSNDLGGWVFLDIIRSTVHDFDILDSVVF